MLQIGSGMSLACCGSLQSYRGVLQSTRGMLPSIPWSCHQPVGAAVNTPKYFRNFFTNLSCLIMAPQQELFSVSYVLRNATRKQLQMMFFFLRKHHRYHFEVFYTGTHSLMTAPRYACKIPLVDCNIPLYDCKLPRQASDIPLPICNIPHKLLNYSLT